MAGPSYGAPLAFMAMVPELAASAVSAASVSRPLWRSIFGEMVPYLEGVLREVRSMLPGMKQGERLPRFTPQVTFPFSDGTHFRQGMPYALWMARRVLDQLQQMPDEEAVRLAAAIRSIGGECFLKLDIPPLQRKGLHAAVG